MKKFISLSIIIALAFGAWFLFLKPGDFTAKIKAQTNVGSLEQSIKNWTQEAKLLDVEIKDESTRLVQEIKAQDSTHVYEWHVTPINDTLSEILVHVTDPENSIANRWKGLFKETDFKKRAKATVLDFNTRLEDHLERITITIEGRDTIHSNFYAYTELEGLQILKANGMMKDISHLQNTMVRNDIEMKGLPFVRVTDWNRETDSIKYQFAFPIIEQDTLPEIIDIKYAKRPEQPAIKATYNGNYITSDRAWYALLNYAKTNNIKVDPRPLEVFYNNPSMGGDESRWKAEIYLPIIE